VLVRISIGNFIISIIFCFFKDFQIRTLDIDSKRCKLQVWDTAGQDRFKCVVSSFYRNANGVLICFDITDMDSFRNVNNWYEEVKRYCPEETPILLIGTKSDLKTRRMVSHEMIQAYTEKNKLSYLETSSKTNENVEKCFIDFSRKLVEHTNQIEMSHKPNPLNLNSERRPVKNSSNSGCYGGDKCTI
jgi:Ras-related protein Rab-1A